MTFYFQKALKSAFEKSKRTSGGDTHPWVPCIIWMATYDVTTFDLFCTADTRKYWNGLHGPLNHLNWPLVWYDIWRTACSVPPGPVFSKFMFGSVWFFYTRSGPSKSGSVRSDRTALVATHLTRNPALDQRFSTQIALRSVFFIYFFPRPVIEDLQVNFS